MKSVLKSMEQVADTLNTASKVTKDITSIGNSYNWRKQAKESGELDQIKREIDLYSRKDRILLRCCWSIWGLMIIATIFFCVTGNDVVLRILHI